MGDNWAAELRIARKKTQATGRCSEISSVPTFSAFRRDCHIPYQSLRLYGVGFEGGAFPNPTTHLQGLQRVVADPSAKASGLPVVVEPSEKFYVDGRHLDVLAIASVGSHLCVKDVPCERSHSRNLSISSGRKSVHDIGHPISHSVSAGFG